jgi:hypothetical protein
MTAQNHLSFSLSVRTQLARALWSRSRLVGVSRYWKALLEYLLPKLTSLSSHERGYAGELGTIDAAFAKIQQYCHITIHHAKRGYTVPVHAALCSYIPRREHVTQGDFPDLGSGGAILRGSSPLLGKSFDIRRL